MGSSECARNEAMDWVRQPLGLALWWGLPLLIGISVNFLGLPPVYVTFVWAGMFAWMGTGCLLNARRCARLHCYISAPVLFLGAIVTTFTAFGWTPLGPHTSRYVINGSLVLALLTFLAEPIWGKYRTH